MYTIHTHNEIHKNNNICSGEHCLYLGAYRGVRSRGAQCAYAPPENMPPPEI